MQQPVVIIGMGEMGGVFARGFLKAGHPVYPVRRQDDMQALASQLEDPCLVLLAVAEKDLCASLGKIPEQWKDQLVLLQNELLPDDWTSNGLRNPTVISVWFEKKPGQDFKVLISSPVFGPRAALVKRALDSLGIPAHITPGAQELLAELVIKNLYIVTTNICGLQTGGTVSQLWSDNAVLMNKVFDDVLQIQQALSGQTFNRDHLLNAVLNAFDGDPDHNCMGRSAPARLQRALDLARDKGLDVPELKRIDALQR